MPFRTKLDYSDNRQIKQNEKTNTILSGGTTFGLPFSALTSGPDLSSVQQISQYIGVISDFSGNSMSTEFDWSTPIDVSIIDSSITPIIPSNSGLTQSTNIVFGSSSSTLIDGNLVNLSYSGVEVDNLYVVSMIETTPGNYTGQVSSDFYIFSADTLDFTGRTIWVDNTEILRTDRLIVGRGAQVGYVLGAINSEGMCGWVPNSGSTSGDTFTTGATLNGNTIEFNRNDITNAYSVDLSGVLSGDNIYNSNGSITGTTRDVSLVNSTLNITGDSTSNITNGVISDSTITFTQYTQPQTLLGYIRTTSAQFSNVLLANSINISLNNYDGIMSGDRTALGVGKGSIIAQSDAVGFVGIQYNTDYSANYINRSLVDKEYVDNNVITGATLSNASGGTITLESGSGTIEITGITNNIPYDLLIVVSDETTQITTGTSKVTLVSPRDIVVSSVKASLTQSGSTFTKIDVKVNDISILPIALSINSGDTVGNVTVSAFTIDEDDKITIDITDAGVGATGLKVYIKSNLK
jgi:hypothetical protein